MKLKSVILFFVLPFCLYFFAWLFVYKSGINTLAIQSEDTVPAVFLPLSILNEQSLYLDTYYNLILEKYPNPEDKDYKLGYLPFYLRKAGGHYLSAFPVITPILAVPVYAVALPFTTDIDWNVLYTISHLSSSLIMSLGVLFFYLLLKNRLKLSENNSVIATIVFGFGTINLAQVSQGLWQHGTVQLFLILTTYYFLKYLEEQKNIDLFLFGVFGGLAVLARPTAALPFAIFSVYLLLKNKFFKHFSLISSGLLLPMLFFLWYNSKFYLSLENQGYSNQIFRNWLGGFPLSFLGVWMSPSKGILVYSPVIIFGLIAFFLLVKNRENIVGLFKKNILSLGEVIKHFYILSGIIILSHTIIISFWKHWFGGWSFGYRMSSDVIPFMIILVSAWLSNITQKKYIKVFYLTLVFSIIVEISGIIFFDGIWHAAYDKGFKDTSWLWSIKDSEFLFNVRRMYVKFGLLNKACPNCAE